MLVRLRLQVASGNHLGHLAILSTPPLSKLKSPLCGGEEPPASQSLRCWTEEAAALQAIFLTDNYVKSMPWKGRFNPGRAETNNKYRFSTGLWSLQGQMKPKQPLDPSLH